MERGAGSGVLCHTAACGLLAILGNRQSASLPAEGKLNPGMRLSGTGITLREGRMICRGVYAIRWAGLGTQIAEPGAGWLQQALPEGTPSRT